jgi:hypothetical protein
VLCAKLRSAGMATSTATRARLCFPR